MKTSERHHLKQNEFALAVAQASDYLAKNQRRVVTLVAAMAVVAIALVGFFAWRNRADATARQMLAEAMVVSEARVQPPTPGTPEKPESVQAPGTYPTEQAKLDAALPKFLAAADAHPQTESGRLARYHAAATLVALNRFDEAIKQYDQLMSASDLLAQMSRLGRAEAQLRASQFDPAIASFKEIAERTDTNLPKEAVLLELARAYTLAGKNEDARKTLNQIVEQHADSPFATEAKKELDKIKG